MGIQIEFNPDLALRKFGTPNREKDECIPEQIKEGEIYNFLKKGQRLYWQCGEVPLRITEGNQKLSKPLASVIIIEEVHFTRNNEIWTRGKYKIIKKLNENDNYFDGYEIRKEEKPKEKKKVGAGFGVILIKDNKILLGMRHPDPDKADSAFRSAGEWSLPGGKLDFGESLEDGAVREVKEETSIIIKNPKVISMHNCKNEHAHFLTAGLLATEWEGEAKVMEADEMIKWEWFDINELPYSRYFPSFEVIENYMQDKFYIKRQ